MPLRSYTLPLMTIAIFAAGHGQRRWRRFRAHVLRHVEQNYLGPAPSDSTGNYSRPQPGRGAKAAQQHPLASVLYWLAKAIQASPSTHFWSFAQSILYRGARS